MTATKTEQGKLLDLIDKLEDYIDQINILIECSARKEVLNIIDNAYKALETHRLTYPTKKEYHL